MQKDRRIYPIKVSQAISYQSQKATAPAIRERGTNGNVIRFLSPLVITDEQLEAGIQIMERALLKVMCK